MTLTEQQALFAFTFNLETQDTVLAGNVTSQVALRILQDIVIAEAVQQAQKVAETKEATEETKEE